MSPTYEHPRPALTVDCVVFAVVAEQLEVLLIRRAGEPFAGSWALPGGFVDLGETVEAAARREALEETGLEVTLRSLLGVYSEPGRDPRGHTVSIVYVAEARGEPAAGDDAAAVRVVALDELPLLAFDHARILKDYARTLR